MQAPKIVIVGGVAGGATAATRLRRLSEAAQITVFERGPHVSFANCGLPYYVGGVIGAQQSLLLATAASFAVRFAVAVRPLHEVVAVDRAAKRVVVRDVATRATAEVPYDFLLLAAGSVPIRPPSVRGIDSVPGIFTVRSVVDSDTIRDFIVAKNVKNAVIVGCGFIGLEMAENLVHRGIKVDMIEKGPHIMPVFDSEMVTDAEANLAARGVQVHFNHGVTGFTEDDTTGKIQVELDDGATASVSCDMVILAIGVRPEITLAKEAGLSIGKLGGIITDEYMRTSDPSIFAVGDAVETKDFVTGQSTIVALANPANRQARVAADNIINPGTSKYRGVQGTSICKVFETVLAATGASEKTLKRRNMPYEKVHLYPFNHVSYYPGAQKIAIKVLFDPTTRKVLGAQASGHDGVDKRIDVVSVAIQGGLTVDDLAETELCYAPQFGAAKDPINLAGMIATNSLNGYSPVVRWSDVAEKQVSTHTQVLDVRDADEIAASGCVPGSINIPLNKLRGRMGEIDKTKPVEVYCAVGQRGYYATRILNQNGFDAKNLTGGYTLFKHML
ncbi:FAD-dependent pyridine nucleotide-disulfide oxidoreductase [Obelidium mucronatum]|nr:FAD-dependent pyridine nucleotide-disulfide oxidoreductase [Obelidium mucronatum]